MPPMAIAFQLFVLGDKLLGLLSEADNQSDHDKESDLDGESDFDCESNHDYSVRRVLIEGMIALVCPLHMHILLEKTKKI